MKKVNLNQMDTFTFELNTFKYIASKKQSKI